MLFKVLPDNEPVHKPGIYLIVNEKTGKGYIGKSSDLLLRYKGGNYVVSAPKLKKEVEQFGRENFTFIPIFIAFDTAILGVAEKELMEDFDVIENGNNSTILRTIWINDGIKDKRLYNSTNIPIGWIKGRANGSAIGRLGGQSTKDMIWITNGTEQSRIPVGAVLPPEWKLGRGPKGIEIAKKANAALNRTPEMKAKTSESVKENWKRRRQVYGSNGRRRLRVRLTD
jgi:hypothetical protein